MKKLLFFLLLPASLFAFQQPGKGTIQLECNIYEVPTNVDSLGLYELHGLAARPIAKAAAVDGKYYFTVPAGEVRMYGVGTHELNYTKILLGTEPKVAVWANANYIGKARTTGSALNKGLENVRNRTAAFKTADEALVAENATTTDPKAKTAFGKKALAYEKTKQVYLDSLKKANPLLQQIAALYVQPSPFAEKTAPENNRLFVAKNYFKYADLTNKAYNQLPELYDAFQAYAAALIETGAGNDRILEIANKQLEVFTAPSEAHRLALGGLITGMKELGPVFVDLSNQYLSLYRNDSYGEIGRLEYDLKKASVFNSGMEVPDLVGNTPEGTSFSLTDLQGKYVLIDFWASWCGPCRREMPNVKVNYDKYHPKGFEILGVSLDREENAWKKAIETDGLTWHHISDLKGWQSEHARLYSITSIPQTILIDPKGKIVARNLRGDQLGQKLAEIYGE